MGTAPYFTPHTSHPDRFPLYLPECSSLGTKTNRRPDKILLCKGRSHCRIPLLWWHTLSITFVASLWHSAKISPHQST